MTSTRRAQLPLFFVTSRLPDCRTLPYSLSVQRTEKLRYGRADGRGTDSQPLNPAIEFQQQTSWTADLTKAIKGSHQGRVIVFIHGYNNSFAEVALRTEKIRVLPNFKGPVIAYSWPSFASFPRYTVDENNNEWDRPYFTGTLLQILALDSVKEVVLVAHSMGSRSAVAALTRVDREFAHLSSKLKNIILVSSDIDRQIFERQASEYLLSEARLKEKRRITIFTSNSDRAVALSDFLHGYDRLGRTSCSDPLVSPPCYPRPMRNGKVIAGLTIVDTSLVSGGFIGHADFIDSKIGREFFCATINGEEQMMGNAYRIIVAGKDPTPLSCDVVRPSQPAG